MRTFGNLGSYSWEAGVDWGWVDVHLGYLPGSECQVTLEWVSLNFSKNVTYPFNNAAKARGMLHYKALKDVL